MNELSAAIPTHLTELPQKAERNKNVMGKDDFMKLLMTQLQNQDPLKPMDHHEFAAQLAQFGSLEQLQNIKNSIDGLSSGYGEGTKFNALALIGKRVDASSSEIDMVSGQSVALKYYPKDEVQPVKAMVYGDGGKIVRELPIDPRSRATEIEWDGKDQDGKQLPSGKYMFRVQGNDKSGQATELASELSGTVTGVDLNGKTPTLVVKTSAGDARVEINKIKNIGTDGKQNDKLSKQVKTKPESPILEVENESVKMAEEDPLESGANPIELPPNLGGSPGSAAEATTERESNEPWVWRSMSDIGSVRGLR